MHCLLAMWEKEWILPDLKFTFEKLCDSVTFFDTGFPSCLDSAEWRRERERRNAALWQTAQDLRQAGRLDLIFCYVLDDFLYPETARKLRSLGAYLVNYNLDAVGQWYKLARTAPYFDVLAMAQRANIDRLAGVCPSVYFMPMAGNASTLYQPVSVAANYQHTVTYIGSRSTYRQHVLVELARRDIDLTVYGYGWRLGETATPAPIAGCDAPPVLGWYRLLFYLRYYALRKLRAEGVLFLMPSLAQAMRRHFSTEPALPDVPEHMIQGAVAYADFGSIFRHSKVNIGFTSTAVGTRDHRQRRQVRLRDFEVPLAGGFYITQDTPELHELYRVGQEIETWDTIDELYDKCMYFTAHPAQAEAIRAQGQARALQDHTWTRRLQDLLAHLKLTVR
jgi:hypothetical protein